MFLPDPSSSTSNGPWKLYHYFDKQYEVLDSCLNLSVI